MDIHNLLFDPPAWYDRANCQGQADIMFPDEGGNMKPARRICAACTVRRECRTLVGSLPLKMTDAGVWYGVAASTRRKGRGSV